MSEISGIAAIWYREFKVFTREKSRVISSIISPLMWLIVFGGGLGSSIQAIENVGYQSFIFPGILGMSILFSSVFFGVYIVWDRKIDFLKEVLVAPISRSSIFLGKVLGGSTDSLIQSLFLIFIGFLLIQVNVLSDISIDFVIVSKAMFVLFLSTVVFVSIGLIIGSQMESPEGFQLIVSFLVFPMLFFSGAFFSLRNLPTYLAVFSYVDPLTYTVDALRGIFLNDSVFPFFLDITILTVYSIVLILAGTFAFKKMKV